MPSNSKSVPGIYVFEFFLASHWILDQFWLQIGRSFRVGRGLASVTKPYLDSKRCLDLTWDWILDQFWLQIGQSFRVGRGLASVTKLEYEHVHGQTDSAESR